MRYLSLFLFFICCNLFAQKPSNVPNTDVQKYEDGSIFQSFLAKPITRQASPAVVPGATYINLCPAGIVDDPLDETKFLFYQGEFLGPITVGGRIALYVCDKSDPQTITGRYGVVLQGSESYDINATRFGTVFTENDTIYYYYVGVDANYKWRICLATSVDGRTFTKHGVVMDFNDVDEKSVSDPSIFYDNGVYYMAYCSWDGIGTYPNNNPGASTIGVKIATSTDKINWTKLEKVIISRGVNPELDYQRVEGVQLLKMGDIWVIVYTGSGVYWSIGMAYSPDINSVFTKYGKTLRYFDKGPNGAWDDNITAVGLIHEFNGVSYFYYQAGDGVGEDLPIGAAIMD